MATIETGNTSNIPYLVNNNRVFFPSEKINVFPCSRRGQASTVVGNIAYYDPEARLNTERTNRLHSALNGFKDSFIISDPFASGDTLVFVLAGYYIEVKDFRPEEIATLLNASTTIYAYLGLHKNIPLNRDEAYTTEILYRQSDNMSGKDANSLDVIHETNSYFTGISFTNSNTTADNDITACPLKLFNYNETTKEWELVQTSLLPKVDHDVLENSVIVDELHVSKNLQVGDPLEPASATTKGNIVAEKNIIAEQDLIAGEDLQVTGNADITGTATVADNLDVGTEGDSNTGTITAKTHIKTPTLEADVSITTPAATITTAADITTANIVTANIATANITTANIETADIETADIETATIDTADITTAGITTAGITTANITKLNVTGEGENQTTIVDATITKLDVTGTEDSKTTLAEASIKKASIITLGVTGTGEAKTTIAEAELGALNVHNNSNNAVAKADQVIVTGEGTNNNIIVRASDSTATTKTIITHDEVNSTTITGTTITGTTIVDEAGTTITDGTVESNTITANSALYQKADSKTMKVPIIELNQVGATDVYHLTISRIGEKTIS